MLLRTQCVTVRKCTVKWKSEGELGKGIFFLFFIFFTSEPKLCGHFLETTSITTPGYLRCTLQTKTWYLKWNSIGIEEKVKFDLNFTVIPWIKFTSWGTANTYPLSSSNNSNFLVSSSRTVTICIGTILLLSENKIAVDETRFRIAVPFYYLFKGERAHLEVK